MVSAFFLKIGDRFYAIKATAFDLEGTVIDLEWAHHKLHRQIAKDVIGISLPVDDEKLLEVVPNFYGGPDTLVYRQILEFAKAQGIEVDGINISDLITRKESLFDDLIRNSDIRPRDGASHIMRLLSHNVPIGICSVTRNIQAKTLIEEAKMEGMVSGQLLLFRSGVTAPKPDPEVYEKAALEFNIINKTEFSKLQEYKRLKSTETGVNNVYMVEIQEIKKKMHSLLVFEDSPTGVESAVKSGATVIGVPAVKGENGKTSEAYRQRLLDKGAMVVLEDYHEILHYLESNMYLFHEGKEGNSPSSIPVEMDGIFYGSLDRVFFDPDFVEGAVNQRMENHFHGGKESLSA
jgi:beta-phosphoglucomutase-like phosphatase (HAD superfamily)